MKEMLTASTHGFVKAANNLGSLNSKFLNSGAVWSSTVWSKEKNKVWVFNFSNLSSSTPGFNYQYRNLCVR